MHRRSLPIADPCDAFRPRPGETFCSKCEKHVHDLSEMTPRQLRRFLDANAGQRVCVAYRTDRRGTIQLRPEPRALGLAIVALGLAACTGYAPEMVHPDEACRDASGYEIDCRTLARGDVLVVPEEVEVGERLPPEPVEPVEPVVEEVQDEQDVFAGAVSIDDSVFEAPFEVQRGTVSVQSAPEIDTSGMLVGDIQVEPTGMRDIGGNGSRDAAMAFADRVDARHMRRLERREARRQRRLARR